MYKYLILFMTILTGSSNSVAKPLMIAHAGGGIDGVRYSNSVEALDKNYAQGFRYFEIDFSWTSDKRLVCLHDWQKRFKQIFGYNTKNPVSLKQFEQLLEKTQGVHPCTLATFASWLKDHPNSKIITDVKEDNLAAIELIVKIYPAIKRQLIPQFYQPYEYKKLTAMGFKNLIWILYQYQGSKASIVEHAKQMDLISISMTKQQAQQKFAKQLVKNGSKVFVYTINKLGKLNKLVNNYQVSGIYTDFLNEN